jgi:hypothetical protein
MAYPAAVPPADAEPAWPYDEPRNVAVFASRRAFTAGEPLVDIQHVEDGDWVFLTGNETDLKADVMLVGLAEVVARDPSVGSTADLPFGWRAWRLGADRPWMRTPSEALREGPWPAGVNVLVAPKDEEKGTGSLDFAFTVPGELLVPGAVKCTSEAPDGRCGCRRAFGGVETGRSTTVGVVRFREIDYIEVVRAYSARGEAGWVEEHGEEMARWVTATDLRGAHELLRRIAVLPEGTRVGVAFTGEEPSMRLTVLDARLDCGEGPGIGP